LTPTLDDSKFIKTSIDNVTNNGLSGAALAAITVLLFLGSFRQTLIILLSLPLSALASIILMNLCGFSLNLFSLGGLALGIGNVMDNSIVMVETIAEGTGMTIGQDARSQLSSEETIDRAESSSKQVESAFVASTTTNIVALLPFLLIGGFISLLFNELVLTIVFSVIASIVVAVTVVPALASRLFAVKASSGLSNIGFLQEFNRRFMHGTANYANFLKNVLKYRLLVVIVTFLILGGSAGVVLAQIPQEILPAINTGQVQINAQFPAGTTLETNRKVMTMIDEILKKQPETDYTFTVIGGGIFGSTVTDNPLRGSSTVTLKPQADVFSYVQRVNGEVTKLNLAGIRVRVNPGRVRGLIVNNSPTPGTDVDVILQGNDYESLQAAGRQVLRALEDVKGANFRPDSDDRQPETQIKPNWERLQAFGLTVQDLGETIQTAIEGSVPTQIQRGNRLVDVRVRFNKDLISQPSQLERLPLFTQLSQSRLNPSQTNQSQNNRQIRLADVATVEDSLSPGEIQRINQRQVYILNGSLNKGGSLSSVLAQVGEIGSSIELPEGVSLLPSSAAEANDALQSSLKVLGGLACFLVFVVMAVQYNSLIDPLVIMFTIPLALAGGVFGLYVTQTSIGATVIMGAVLLVGIVVNNAIIMVELANQIREEQKCDRFTAITTAAPQRFRAILMTAITTVLGAFPLALGLGEGGEFLRPLGVVVFSGLSLSTLLTLFIIPCFYLLLHEFSPRAISRPLSVGLKYRFRRVFRKIQS
jgi:multidrug efflux pump subunit AcrB